VQTKPFENNCIKWHPVDAAGESIKDDSKQILLKMGNGVEFLTDCHFIIYSSDRGNETFSLK
jgi:hypothetical protein